MIRDLAPEAAEKLRRDIEGGVKNAARLDEQWSAILQEYEGRYIAFRNGTVVAAAASESELRTQLETLELTDGHLYLIFVTDKPYIL